MRKAILLLILIGASIIVVLWTRSATPVVELPSPVIALGQATPITIHVRDPNGVRKMAAFVEQNGASYLVWETTQPSRPTDISSSFAVGVKATPQLKDGKAKLIIEATSNDFRRKKTRLERDVTIATQAPAITVDSEQHYLYLGMADLARFSVSGSWTEAGVRVGDQAFRAWPMPGGKPGFFSLFAIAPSDPLG